MLDRSHIILLAIAVNARYWMLSKADVNVCSLQANRREKVNASCDFETSGCTARFTSPMSNFWILKKGSVGSNVTGRINGGHSRGSSGSYYLFNTANIFPKGDQTTDQLLLPPLVNNNICLRFWYNLASAKSNLKVIANGRNIFNQTNKTSNGWVQKYVSIAARAPLQIIFESTKLDTFGYVGIDDVIVEIEKIRPNIAVSSTKHSNPTTRITSAKLFSIPTSTTLATSSSSARKSLATKNTFTTKTTTTYKSMAPKFTSLVHTIVTTIRKTDIVTNIRTPKSATSNTNSTTLATIPMTTPRKTVATTASISATTARKTVSTTVLLSGTATKTTVSITTTKKPSFTSTMTAATKTPFKTTPTTKRTTTYASTVPILFTFDRLSTMSTSTTLATSPSSARKVSISIATRNPIFTHAMTTATKSSFKTLPTTKTTSIYSSKAPKFTSLVYTTRTTIRKTDLVTNIRTPKSTTSNTTPIKLTTTPRTTPGKSVSTTTPISATTARKTVPTIVPLSATAPRTTVSITTTNNPSVTSAMIATTKSPFKTTLTTNTTTIYASTTPIIFTFDRLSTIPTSSTLAISPSSTRKSSTSIATRNPIFTHAMTIATKTAFKTTPTIKTTTAYKSMPTKFASSVRATISTIRKTDLLTNIRTPKSTTSNTTSTTSTTATRIIPMKTVSKTTPTPATTAKKTMSTTIPLSATANRTTVLTNPTSVTTSRTTIPTTKHSSVTALETIVSKTAPTSATTARRIISSRPQSTYVHDTTVSTTISASATKVWTTMSSSMTAHRTIISTATPISVTTGTVISTTTPSLGSLSRKLVSTTVSESANAPKTTVSTISPTSATTQRPTIATNTPTSAIISKGTVSRTTLKLVFDLNGSRTTVSTASKSFTNTSTKTSASTKVNILKTMLLSAVQPEPSTISFTASKSILVTASARSYHNIKTTVSTKIDAIKLAESKSPAASEISKIPISNSGTIQITITSQPANNTQTNVQFSHFTMKGVNSQVTSPALLKSTSSGKTGHFDKHKSSSDESNANETVIIAVLCSLAGMFLLVILLLLVFRRKNGRMPFAFIANKANVNLFKDPNDESEMVLIQLQKINRCTD